MSRRTKEEVTRVVAGKYYYRGRYWSALHWSKLNGLDGAPDATASPGEGSSSAVEPEAVPRRGRTLEPATAAGR